MSVCVNDKAVESVLFMTSCFSVQKHPSRVISMNNKWSDLNVEMSNCFLLFVNVRVIFVE